MISILKKDLIANFGSFRGTILVILYRLANICSVNRKNNLFMKIFCTPYLIFYRLISELFLNFEIQAGTSIGEGLIIDHGFNIVINKNSTLGRNCRLRHGVTIGCNVMKDGSQGPSPRIGDNVEFGANCSVVGNVVIGNNCRIAANSLVLNDVPDGATVMGVPAVVIKIKN
nr:DapH/DapD/GlmU-related protein [uncultured Albidiferax sp.]